MRALPFLSRLVTLTLRWVLRRLVRFETSPQQTAQIGLDPSLPVCYALHVRQVSAWLVLDEATKLLGLPRASAPLVAPGIGERSSCFFLTRSGQPSPLQRNPYRYSRRLQRIVAAVQSTPQTDVQVVPVSIFWGRAPDKQNSLIRAVLADSWVAPGALRQMLRLIFHGRSTLLKFGAPIMLRAALGEGTPDAAGASTAVRRIGRLLRAQYRHERELAVGPNLSHRMTLVNALIRAPRVHAAIAAQAATRGTTPEQAELRARRIAVEIASDYSHPFIRAYEIALSALWNRLYNGVEWHRFDDVARAGQGAELVYVPCHRSHIDYLLLSYTLFRRGLLPPHIAAGENLNLPVVGPILRRGGAFFLRRSFRGDDLYAAVFGEYLHTIITRRFPIEFFVEGGRSRTGRTLAPRTGILGMTVDSHLRDAQRPLVFVPIYIGYEQLLEGDSYVAELSGQAKRKETLLGLLRALGELRRRNFGRVHVNVGEPIPLDALLDEHWPGWRDLEAQARARDAAGLGAEEHPAPPSQPQPQPQARDSETQPAADDAAAGTSPRARTIAALATAIVTRINDALVINPVNLLATAMLGSPRHAMDAGRLAGQIDLLAELLREVPYSSRQQLTTMNGTQIIDYAREHRLVERIAHPLGDIVSAQPRQAMLLTYFRNNVLHAFALPALIACLVARNRRIGRTDVLRIARSLAPFLRAELFLSIGDDELDARVEHLIAALRDRGVLVESGDALEAPGPSLPGSLSIHALAQVMRQPLERYFLTVTTLVRFGPGSLSARALEDVCLLLAGRLAALHEPGGRGFTDGSPFRSIVQTLIDLKLVTEEGGRLRFEQALEDSAHDADLLLPQDVGLSISHATQLPAEQIAQALAARR